MNTRLTTAQLKAFGERDRRLAAYALKFWNVSRCIYCGKCVLAVCWHPECEEAT